MHIVTYKIGMSKNLKSKTAIRLKHFVYDRTHICFGYCKRHIRNTILLYKVKFCGKVLKKPCDTQIKWYFIFSDHGCSCFLIKYISDLYN